MKKISKIFTKKKKKVYNFHLKLISKFKTIKNQKFNYNSIKNNNENLKEEDKWYKLSNNIFIWVIIFYLINHKDKKYFKN